MQRIELAVAGYREEIAVLRSELGRRQSDIDRTSSARADMDRVFATTRESLLRVQADLRESDQSVERLKLDLERARRDVDDMKAQLQQKEEDVRSSLASLLEFQRQSAEEKSILRAEIR